MGISRNRKWEDEIDDLADELGAGTDDLPDSDTQGLDIGDIGEVEDLEDYTEDNEATADDTASAGSIGDSANDAQTSSYEDDASSSASQGGTIEDYTTSLSEEETDAFLEEQAGSHVYSDEGNDENPDGPDSTDEESADSTDIFSDRNVDIIASPRKDTSLENMRDVHGLDPQASDVLRGLLGYDLEARRELLEEEARRTLGASLADARAIGSSGSLGLTGAQGALEGDIRSKALLDLQQGLFNLENQGAEQQLAGMEFFDRAADRMREDEMIALMREMFGLDVDPEDIIDDSNAPGPNWTDDDNDGFDDATGTPIDQEPPDFMTGLVNAAAGTGRVTVDQIEAWLDETFPDGGFQGSLPGTLLGSSDDLPPGVHWIDNINGVNTYKDEETGELYHVPVGF